jgi:uroporphyrin-3 C-methyltransferase
MEKAMTDNKQKESKSAAQMKADAQVKQGLAASNSQNTTADKKNDSSVKKQEPKKTPVQEKKISMKTSTKTPTSRANNSTSGTAQKLSKTAVFSLLIALAASAGVGGLYYWNMQQQAATKQEVLQQTQQSLAKSEQQIKQLLSQQQTKLSQQLSNTITQIQKDNQVKINQLESTVERLSQNQPSDWLLHEAEYLIRIATRTMWLEHDTRTAIGLLQDADMRLKELKNPELLPIRQLIREDIAMLKLMPNLDSEEVIMTLMGMNKQLKRLPLAMVKIPEGGGNKADFTLSENTDDWRANLAKTWQKFLADFITVRRRSGNVEPLMSPQYQQNLRENLSLKLQLAQWATSEQKQKVYDQALAEIQQWLNDYFDMDNVENQNFYQGIQQLKSKIVSYDYPSSLLSLKAIREVLADKPLTPMLDSLEQQNKQTAPAEEKLEQPPTKTAPQQKVEPQQEKKSASTSEAI